MGHHNHPYRPVSTRSIRISLGGSWKEDAACRDSDPEYWFEKAETITGDFARRTCEICPVKIDCWSAALEEEKDSKGLRYGLRGGLTPSDRKHLAKRIGEENE